MAAPRPQGAPQEAVPARIQALLHAEAGLKAELALVPAEVAPFSAPRQIGGLRDALSVLQKEEEGVRKRMRQRRKELRDLKTMHSTITDAIQTKNAIPDLSGLSERVMRLRRDLLIFCKQQWAPPEVTDGDFEGDFWDAIVRACAGEGPMADGSDPGLIYYDENEEHLAILLVQAGLVTFPFEGQRVLRLASELFSSD